MAKLDVIEAEIFYFAQHFVARGVSSGIPASGK
jgi:hypothetical protein